MSRHLVIVNNILCDLIRRFLESIGTEQPVAHYLSFFDFWKKKKKDASQLIALTALLSNFLLNMILVFCLNETLTLLDLRAFH